VLLLSSLTIDDVVVGRLVSCFPTDLDVVMTDDNVDDDTSSREAQETSTASFENFLILNNVGENSLLEHDDNDDDVILVS
jgi:hypothetical protein